VFERYTEKARRVVFFARYEASQYGSPYIGTEHLLLGLIREAPLIASQLRPQQVSREAIRQELARQIPVRERISASAEVPLAPDCQRALMFAAEEAERLAHRLVRPEHLFLGLMRVEQGLAAKILKGYKVSLEETRVSFAKQMGAAGPKHCTVGTSAARHNSTAALLAFLEHLRAGHIEELACFIAPEAHFIDANGRRWAGQKGLTENLRDLCAPFATRNARYILEESFEPTQELCIAAVLWEDVPRIDKSGKGLLRVTVTLAPDPAGNMGRQVYSVQLTPLK
jgi:hypothetical protein